MESYRSGFLLFLMVVTGEASVFYKVRNKPSGETFMNLLHYLLMVNILQDWNGCPSKALKMKVVPKKLTELSKEEQLKFINSFDKVFTDMDGCLWLFGDKNIDGAPEAINQLRNLGKECYFVTNNSIMPLKYLVHRRMKEFKAVEKEIIRPTSAMIWYLKKINFDKEIYVIGMQALKDELEESGYKVLSDEVSPISEAADAIEAALKSISPNVGAVIMDFPINVDFIMLQKCVEYITKNNALFLAGTFDTVLPFRGTTLIGAPYFVQAISEISGKKPLIFSKPGKEFHEYIIDVLGHFDPKRVLFIGDSAVTDMAFATQFGYQKLLPLSGITRKKDLEDWQYDETWKPDYYVDSLRDIETVIKNLRLDMLEPKL